MAEKKRRRQKRQGKNEWRPALLGLAVSLDCKAEGAVVKSPAARPEWKRGNDGAFLSADSADCRRLFLRVLFYPQIPQIAADYFWD
ncbi:MAG: hypothetical protein ACOX9E_04915 [Lentisphaeria bacterium]|jgi:hypothetical protein